MSKSTEDMVIGLNEGHVDIESAELMSFTNKWENYRADIPINYIDFYKIHATVREFTPEVLNDWKEKLLPSSELEEKLGILSGLMDQFVDYVNTMRRTLVLQYLHTFTSTGYLNIVMDSEGKDSYVVNEEAFEIESVSGLIESILKAKENHIG